MTTSSRHEQQRIDDIDLFLADSTKSLELAPTKIDVGRIKLRGWQIHPVHPMPADFASWDGYLIKINYELDLTPGVLPPSWVEVGFDFLVPEATVSDALPRSVVHHEEARSYALSPAFGFARSESGSTLWPPDSVAASIAMPALVPFVDVFGIGGSTIRWRHTPAAGSSVRPGSYSGWLALLVRSECRAVPVVASGRYHVEPEAVQGFREGNRSEAFVIQLPMRSAEKAADPLAGAGAAADYLESDAAAFAPTADVFGHRPRVFVSYAHDTEAHKAAVLAFCNFLLELGIDVRVDQWGLDERRDWQRWTTTQIMRADFVIVVASPVYRDAGNGEMSTDRHRGVQSEFSRLADLLHSDRTTWTRKIIPVVLPGRSIDEIPVAFQPHTADHYVVSSLSAAGAAGLLHVLGAQLPERAG